MGFLSKVWKGVKKVAKIALPAAGAFFGLGGKLPDSLSGVGDMVKSGLDFAKDYGPLLGQGAEYLGGMAANEASAKSVADQMRFQGEQGAINRQFTADQAAQQMAFQERMSSTAHQREVADYRAAGLNPILSGTGGMGSSSPQGAMGTGSTAQGASYQARNVSSGAASSALAQAQLALSTRLAEADIAQKAATTRNIEAQTKTEMNRPENIIADTYLKRQTMTTSEMDERLKGRQIIHEIGKTALTDEQIQNVRAQTGLHTATAKSASTKADLDALLSYYERLVAMGQGASSAVRNLVPVPKLFNK